MSFRTPSYCKYYTLVILQVAQACWRAGLESSSLVIGVDFTASNEWKGRKSFNQNCLHRLVGSKVTNPYQKVISILGQTLAPFDDDNKIPAYGFGDTETKDHSVFPFRYDEKPCNGFEEVCATGNWCCQYILQTFYNIIGKM